MRSPQDIAFDVERTSNGVPLSPKSYVRAGMREAYQDVIDLARSVDGFAGRLLQEQLAERLRELDDE